MVTVRLRMLKQLFIKVEKIPIAKEIIHFSFLPYYSINLHVLYFLKT